MLFKVKIAAKPPSIWHADIEFLHGTLYWLRPRNFLDNNVSLLFSFREVMKNVGEHSESTRIRTVACKREMWYGAICII